MISPNAAKQLSFRAEQADLFASVRSCEPIGMRSEKSLFSPLCGLCVFRAPGALSAFCVTVFFRIFPTTHYPLFTPHFLLP
jgi:hypothetical protein